MVFDDIFKYIGDFGRYQKRLFVLLCLPGIFLAYHNMAYIFLLAKPNFRCKLPDESLHANYTLPEHIINNSFPWDSNTQTWSPCYYYELNVSNVNNYTQHVPFQQIATCNKYIYDRSVYKSSALMEWNIVCDKAWLRQASGSFYMIGFLLGSIIFGHYSDKYGRKPMLLIALVLQIIFGISAGLATNFITHTLSRIFIGISATGFFLIAFVMSMEMVAVNRRLFVGIVILMFFPIGYLLTAFCAYFIKDWRQLQILLSVPSMLFLSYYWIIPESARWLLAKGRSDDSIKIIKHSAKINNISIPQELYDNLKNDSESMEKSPATAIDLFRYPNLRRKTLLIFLNWFVVSGTYYGLSWNTNNLGGNDLLNFIYSALVELPGYASLLYTLNKWGRRNTLCCCMLVVGIMLLTTALLPKHNYSLFIFLSMMGKMAVTSCFGAIYVFSAEQFPTPVRNVGIGCASMIARIGGFCSPYVLMLGDIWRPYPFVIFGSLSMVAGLLSLLLPETLNQKLPESIEEGERFGKKLYFIDDVTNNTEEIVTLKEKP